MNIHVNDPNNSFAADFIDLNESLGFLQQITVPTHTAGNTLDLVFTRESFMPTNIIVYNGIMDEGLSDHYLIQSSFIVKPKVDKGPIYFTYRPVKSIDTDTFYMDLKNNSTSYAQSPSTNLNLEVQNLFENINCCLDKHAPVITKSKSISSKLFTNTEIKLARREKRKCERKFLKTLSPIDKAQLQIARKRLIQTVKRGERDFYQKKFATSKGDTRATYQIINHLLHKNQVKILPDIDHKQTLANKFATFFTEKIHKLIEEIENETSLTPHRSEFGLCDSRCLSLSTFTAVNGTYLQELIKKTNNKFSSVDNIPSILLNGIQETLFDNILHIVNLSLTQGIFPENFKNSHVTPVAKNPKGDKNSMQNFRPLFNLSFGSKLLERCALEQFLNHLESNQLTFKHESAFKRKHCCETALLKIYNDILQDLGPNQYTIMLFLDFSSAFDLVNHKLLLKKLEHQFNVKGTALKWFESYLENRTFQVKIDNKLSDCMEMHHGVPQGSVLGPVLFSSYTQELHCITESHGLNIHMFADDIQIYCTGDGEDLEKKKVDLKNCFDDIVRWSKGNYLKLNEEKTKFLVISKKLPSVLQSKIGNSSFTMEKVVKNLGFFVDRSLNFSAQINQVCRRGFNLLRNLWRISAKLRNVELKTQIIKSCLLPHIDYCNSLYACLPQKQIKKLQRLMNCSIRFIFSLRRYEQVSISSYAKKCHFLPVQYRVNYKICMLAYKCLHDLAPEYLQELIMLKQSLESLRINRDRFLLHTPMPDTAEYKNRRFANYAPKLWNSLPYDIRSSNSLAIFQSKLKTFYFSQAYT